MQESDLIRKRRLISTSMMSKSRKQQFQYTMNVQMNTPFNFLDRSHCHIETSPLIRQANQWTGFYMITASLMKELKQSMYIKTPSRNGF